MTFLASSAPVAIVVRCRANAGFQKKKKNMFQLAGFYSTGLLVTLKTYSFLRHFRPWPGHTMPITHLPFLLCRPWSISHFSLTRSTLSTSMCTMIGASQVQLSERPPPRQAATSLIRRMAWSPCRRPRAAPSKASQTSPSPATKSRSLAQPLSAPLAETLWSPWLTSVSLLEIKLLTSAFIKTIETRKT